MFVQGAAYLVPTCRVFRRSIINVETKGGWRAKAGIKGQADYYAIVRGGRIVELETKAARGVLEEAQKAWRAFCIDWQIPHLVLRAQRNEAPSDTVQRWCEELKEAIR